ncbi:histidine phosphatase family protein [Bordetella avium]|uniref:Probable phosphoglycerate mutase 2 n=1 Tax=Bordetella avium (strain 197N) TaxID=360910 RepID=Q2KVT0_BORA1|nr:histidine phosphatase family protein [Bordetella avium]AZY51811.1 histidine phosphatase family protein [Bordetella avium]RIQ13323.1 histidine phosphatase family protein [Bordetella avium]RIQ16422.1 histidine phosphatase family protein [Bordetella avium]RIQ31108.1 histidine phosphatase family protein [Bordetella avium]RIQ48421.1 histidine phosphatase family protein [Bordetella avium]
MTEIWFIRHGETDWNRQRRLQGWQDIPLNSAGLEQAQRLTERLRAETAPFDALYSSDLKRALSTAEPVSQALELRMRLEPGIRERSFGVLEGLDLERIDELAPAAAAAWKSRDPTRALDGGETLGHFCARVVTAVEDIAQRHAGQRVLVFTHGGVLDIIWRQAEGVALNAPRHASLLNVSINRVAIDGKQWRILDWGDVAHVKQEVGNDIQP